MADHKAKKDWYAKIILQRLLDAKDTVKTSADFEEEVEWMRSFGTLKSSYMVVDHYLSHGKYSKAISLLDLISGQFELTDEGHAELSRMKQYVQFLQNLDLDHRTEYQLNPDELATLREMALGEDRAALRARNILSFFYNEEFEAWSPDEDSQNYAESGNVGGSAEETINVDEKKNTLITIAPNPVSDEFKIKYLSASIYGNDAEIFVLDGSGNIMFEGQIRRNEEEFFLNASGWQPGTYFCVYKSKTGYQDIIPFNVLRY